MCAESVCKQGTTLCINGGEICSDPKKPDLKNPTITRSSCAIRQQGPSPFTFSLQQEQSSTQTHAFLDATDLPLLITIFLLNSNHPVVPNTLDLLGT